MLKPLELAVMFRNLDPNLGHTSVFEALHFHGFLYLYGLFRGTPPHHRRKRRLLANHIAEHLEAHHYRNHPPTGPWSKKP